MKLRYFCFFSVCLAILFGGAIASVVHAQDESKAADPKSFYLIGNSLTWDTVPANLDGDVQWHVDCGKSLPYIFANPGEPCVKNSTLWPTALKDKQYDVIAVQSHYGSSMEEDATVISEWMEMQPNAEFVVHTGWSRSASRAEEWSSLEAGGDMVHSIAYIDALIDLLKRTNPSRIVRRTQAMDALEWLAQDIEAGKAPFAETSGIYRDAIHMNTLTGRYVMHNLMRKALGQQASTAGFTKLEPEMKTYLDTLLVRAGVQPAEIPADQLTQSQSTVVYVSEAGEKRVVFYDLNATTGVLDRMGEVDLGGAPGSLAVNKDSTKVYAAVRSISEFATLGIDRSSGGLSLLSTAAAAGSAAYVFPDRSGKWLLGAYYGEGLVSVSRIDDGGRIAGDPVHVVEVGEKAHCIQTDPSNGFVFAPHTGDLNRVDQFAFDVATGSLARNVPGFLAGVEGGGPRHMQFHPNGKWVYLVNEQGKSVSLCDYDTGKGTLTLRQTVSTHPDDWDPSQGSCADIEITADGKFVYASNRGHDSIARLSIDPESGELKLLGQTPTGETPRSFNLMPVEGQRLLVAAGQKSNTLTVYRRNPNNGNLKKLDAYDCGKSPSWVLGVSLK